MKPAEATAISAAINLVVDRVPDALKEIAALRAADALNNAALGVRFSVKPEAPFELRANVQVRELSI